MPIVGAEIARAALALPLAFLQEAEHFVLVAVLSLTPGRNMLVGPDGRWLGAYVPACVRSYPFRLLPTQQTSQLALCIEENEDAVGAETAREDFFDQDGNLSPRLKRIFEFLNEFERARHGHQHCSLSIGRRRPHSALADQDRGSGEQARDRRIASHR